MLRLLEGFTLLPGKAEMQFPLSSSVLTQHQLVFSLGTSFFSFVRLSLIYEELGEIRAGVVLSHPSFASQPGAISLLPIRISHRLIAA